MDKLIFSSTLKQKLACAAAQIVSIDDLCRKLSLTCYFNFSSLKAHAQEIISILQRIITSTKSLQENLLLIAHNNCLLI